MRRFPLLLVISALLLATASQCSAQLIFHKKKKVDKSTDASNTAEPDKQLYEKSLEDIKHGRHDQGRLGMQTLINTYPDSEYLAKAKLAIADSYYKEGGTSNITQAINGYKDFIVFFPFLPEAAYAQMQVAMANYNEMTKADRDNTHALDAESELQTFLQKYPKDPLAPKAEQKLRDVQELLAEGQYRIAYYYYVKGDRRAAAGRLIPLVRRYPLYSKSDSALWMLGDIFEKSERKDIAGTYYAQIIKNYPLSPKANDARGKLKAFGMPVPQPDPKAVAWMTAEQNTPRPHESLVHKPLDFFHSTPDVRMAAVHGTPNMEPEGEDQLGMDTLSGKSVTTMAAGTGSGTTGIVATVKPGEAASSSGSSTGGATTEDAPSSSTESTTGSGAADSQAGSSGASSDSTTTSNSTTSDSSKADNTQGTTDSSNQNSKQKESSSKKKGLKKLLPW